MEEEKKDKVKNKTAAVALLVVVAVCIFSTATITVVQSAQAHIDPTSNVKTDQKLQCQHLQMEIMST